MTTPTNPITSILWRHITLPPKDKLPPMTDLDGLTDDEKSIRFAKEVLAPLLLVWADHLCGPLEESSVLLHKCKTFRGPDKDNSLHHVTGDPMISAPDPSYDGVVEYFLPAEPFSSLTDPSPWVLRRLADIFRSRVEILPDLRIEVLRRLGRSNQFVTGIARLAIMYPLLSPEKFLDPSSDVRHFYDVLYCVLRIFDQFYLGSATREDLRILSYVTDQTVTSPTERGTLVSATAYSMVQFRLNFLAPYEEYFSWNECMANGLLTPSPLPGGDWKNGAPWMCATRPDGFQGTNLLFLGDPSVPWVNP